MGEEQTLCIKACEQFSQADFEAATNSLNDLEELKKSDWRTSLNKAIVAFCQSHMTKEDDFSSEMYKICDQLQINLEIGCSSSKQPQDGTTLCLYYNYALSLFLGCQYSASLSVVDKLLPICEPFDDILSLKIAFFAIHLNFIRGSWEKSLNLISQVENILQTENSESSQWSKTKLSILKTYGLLLSGNTKACKRELKNIANTFSAKPNLSYSSFVGYLISWMKCHFEYLRGNGRKTLKLVNSMLSFSEVEKVPYSESLTIPSFDHATAIKIAKACGLYQSRKFNMAAMELLQAWDALDKFCETSSVDNGAISLKSLGFAGPAYAAVAYNMAVCLLHAGLYQAAFDSFVSTISSVKHMPQAWLHMAECCIQIYNSSKPNPQSTSCRLSIVGNSFGNGLHRKIPVNGYFCDRKSNQQGPSNNKPAQQRPTLEFASACLSNCLMLIGQYRTVASTAAKASVSDDPTPSKTYVATGLPQSVVSSETLDALQAHALLSLAYVSLGLNNFNLAVRAGTDLLALGSKLSPVVKYLGHLYMAEASMNIDRIPDAMGYLQAGNIAHDFQTGIQSMPGEGRAANSSVSGTTRDKFADNDQSEFHNQSNLPALSGEFWPKTQADAQAVLIYNLAVGYASRGDFDKAKMHLETAMASIAEPWPTHFYHLAFYLALSDAPTTGTAKALDLVKKYYPHVTPNR